MRKLFQIVGTVLMIGGVVFLLIDSFLVTVSSGEDFARDIFGFPIPHPPVWTSFIPFLGSFLAFIFEFFSLHGLVGTAIFGTLLYIGVLLIGFDKKGNEGD